MADAKLVEEIRKLSKERGIEFYFAQFVDMYARPSAKLVPAANLDDLVSDGAGFAGFAAGEIGQGPNDPDIAAIPDLASFTPVPWEPSVARFACDITVDGEAWPYDPRTILRNQLAKAKALGYEYKMGLELEYFLVELADDGSIAVADKLDTLEKPCYDLNGLSRHYRFLTTVSKYVNELGWGNYANDHEDANGQFEQNFHYDDALVSCDRGVFFRYMVHQLAERYGKELGRNILATFMPKPFTTLTGNGCHFHMSLWKDGQNVFLDDNDPRGLGLSETAYHFIGGLKRHARAYSAVTAPTVNVNQSGAPGAKIQDGILLAASGGTVNVGAGTYAQNVTVNKSLTLLGASGSAIIQPASGTAVTITTGTVPSITRRTKRAGPAAPARNASGTARAMAHRSCLKYSSTAINVPTWHATSNARPSLSASQPSTSLARMR